MKAFTSLQFSTSKYPKTLFQSCQISWGARSLAMPILSRHRSRPRVWGCRSPTGPAWCQHEAYSRLGCIQFVLSLHYWFIIRVSAYFCWICSFYGDWDHAFACLTFFVQLSKARIWDILRASQFESSKGTNFDRRHQRQDAAARFGLILFRCS